MCTTYANPYTHSFTNSFIHAQVFVKLSHVQDSELQRGYAWDKYYYPLFTHKETETRKGKPHITQGGTNWLVIHQWGFLILLGLWLD